MTNFEYYKEEILNIINENEDFGLLNNKPTPCVHIGCEECDLDQGRCSKDVFKWLYAEHKEQPKLTKKERQFCELVETGWITRDRDGKLGFRTLKPSKGISYWNVDDHEHPDYIYMPIYHKPIFECNFSFITWDDAEPWSIEDLLKLEVEE